MYALPCQTGGIAGGIKNGSDLIVFMDENIRLADGKFSDLKNALEGAMKFNTIKKIGDYETNTGALSTVKYLNT